MSLFILDTDHLSLFERRHQAVVAKVLATPVEQRAITITTVEEQLRGRLSQIKNARNAEAYTKACLALHEAIRFFASLRVLDFDLAAHAHFDRLKQAKIRIGSQDLRIAAVALSTQSILVTRNRSDFEKVPELKIEDWSIV